MKEIKMHSKVGPFAENKDTARDIRTIEILPALKKGDSVILDFTGVDSTTQSFIHALISDTMRQHGIDVLDKLYFKSCNTTVQKIIEIVVEYMQAVPDIHSEEKSTHR